jgi:hypothetical protein
MRLLALLADADKQAAVAYLTGSRMAATPASAFWAYRSKLVASPSRVTTVSGVQSIEYATGRVLTTT